MFQGIACFRMALLNLPSPETFKMRLLCLAVVVLMCLPSVAVVAAKDRPAANPSGQSVATSATQAEAAIDRAARANKYAFLFFWKENGPQTSKAWETLKPTTVKLANVANFVSIRATNPAEKKLVDKYGVRGAPMPLVLAIAPNGAITKAFTKAFDEKELRTAFVSPCTQRYLKALQSNKLVFVCLVDQANPQEAMPVPKGVQDFKADKKFAAATEIVMLNVRDAREATLLKELDVSANHAPMTIFLAPPGAVVGTFTRSTTKETFTAKLAAAQSGGCSGGSCGSGGCGPKK
jgi:hypothetical protein